MSDIVKYNKIIPYEDFLDDKIPERRFKLVYTDKEFFFLTQEERDFLLEQVSIGAELIEIGEYTFRPNFRIMYPIKKDIFKRQFVIGEDGVAREVTP